MYKEISEKLKNYYKNWFFSSVKPYHIVVNILNATQKKCLPFPFSSTHPAFFLSLYFVTFIPHLYLRFFSVCYVSCLFVFHFFYIILSFHVFPTFFAKIPRTCRIPRAHSSLNKLNKSQRFSSGSRVLATLCFCPEKPSHNTNTSLLTLTLLLKFIFFCKGFTFKDTRQTFCVQLCFIFYLQETCLTLSTHLFKEM